MSFYVLLFMVNMFRRRKEIGSFSSPIAVLDGKRRRDLGDIENKLIVHVQRHDKVVIYWGLRSP